MAMVMLRLPLPLPLPLMLILMLTLMLGDRCASTMVHAFTTSTCAPPSTRSGSTAGLRMGANRQRLLSSPLIAGRGAGRRRKQMELHALPPPMSEDLGLVLHSSAAAAAAAGTGSSTDIADTITTVVGNSANANANAILLASAAVSSDETESWRQYVPLAVICLVLLDIVLGSPMANLALAPMRRAAEDGAGSGAGGGEDDGSSGGGGLFGGMGINSMISGGDSDGGGDGGGTVLRNPKERVDTAAIAQTTLDKARGTVELMEYLEQNKSDEQRYDEIRKKLDRQDEMLRDKLDNLE
mmetsp:Transcript_28233/g.57321  ORF Transcript_28233/g.57321 Transcript_28233/m.57321 type:complete len:297 (-) Transcript_28233:650-1540(-)